MLRPLDVATWQVTSIWVVISCFHRWPIRLSFWWGQAGVADSVQRFNYEIKSIWCLAGLDFGLSLVYIDLCVLWFVFLSYLYEINPEIIFLNLALSGSCWNILLCSNILEKEKVTRSRHFFYLEHRYHIKLLNHYDFLFYLTIHAQYLQQLVKTSLLATQC